MGTDATKRQNNHMSNLRPVTKQYMKCKKRGSGKKRKRTRGRFGALGSVDLWPACCGCNHVNFQCIYLHFCVSTAALLLVRWSEWHACGTVLLF